MSNRENNPDVGSRITDGFENWYEPFEVWRDSVAYALGYDIFEDSWAYADEDEQLKIISRQIAGHRRIESLAVELLDTAQETLAYLTDLAINLDGEVEESLAAVRLRLHEAINRFG
jgi:hypothetical protein